ncbi:prenyltransferase [Haloarchaeobius amylolyticus]|uniref:prenyltransferase n=1 Tax=Haloarchaeobius amylolyticus TaxID=1198296 RepID=UPI00226E9B65|nr:prenyltransferase [Haloarchaeobius amylolyticus]
MTDVATRLASAVPSEETLPGYLLRLSRPRFWFYLAGPVVVGVAYAAGSSAELFAPVAVALFLYFTFPANVFLYGVNDVFDRDVDEYNPKKEGKEVRYRDSPTVNVLILASGVVGLPFVFVLSQEAGIAMAAYYVLAVQYSAPPFRFKTKPLFDSLSNGLYVLPGVVAYAALAGEFPPLLAVAGGWLWTMGMHTFSAIPDIEPDREAGIRTTATFLGEARTYLYCGLTWLAAAGAFALVDWRLGLLLGVYPVFVAGIALSDVAVDRAYWWFPFVNTVVGMLMTMGALWVMVHG